MAASDTSSPRSGRSVDSEHCTLSIAPPGTASNSEAVRLIRGGGITINNRRISNEKERLLPADAIDARYFLVKKGKKERFLVRIERP